MFLITQHFDTKSTKLGISMLGPSTSESPVLALIQAMFGMATLSYSIGEVDFGTIATPIKLLKSQPGVIHDFSQDC